VIRLVGLLAWPAVLGLWQRQNAPAPKRDLTPYTALAGAAALARVSTSTGELEAVRSVQCQVPSGGGVWKALCGGRPGGAAVKPFALMRQRPTFRTRGRDELRPRCAQAEAEYARSARSYERRRSLFEARCDSARTISPSFGTRLPHQQGPPFDAARQRSSQRNVERGELTSPRPLCGVDPLSASLIPGAFVTPPTSARPMPGARVPRWWSWPRGALRRMASVPEK